MAKLTNEELIEAFKELSIIELSDFVKLFEETFDVTAAAVAVAGPAGGGAESVEEEQTAFDGQLSGPTAIAFIKGDAVAAAKSLTDFAKANPKLVIKTGIFEGKALNASEVVALAALESRELQLARVAGVLKAPMSALARTVDALRIKLEEESGAAPAADADAPAAEEAAAPAEAVTEAPAADAPTEEAAATEAN